MTMEILPLKGIGALTFGDAPDSLIAYFGTPDHHRPDYRRDEVRYNWKLTQGSFTAVCSGAGLVEWSIGPDASDIRLFGRSPFASLMWTLATIKRRSKIVYERFGFLISTDLGLALTGFHDRDKDDLAVTGFVAGRWDSHLRDASIWHRKTD